LKPANAKKAAHHAYTRLNVETGTNH